jgi:hypothetical protein
VTPLVTQLPWTHNLLILTQSKRSEEREFYLRMALQQRWSKRELERQFRLAAFERAAYFTRSRTPISDDPGQGFRRCRTPFQADRGQRFSVKPDRQGTRG